MEKLLDVGEAGEVVAGETVGKQCEEHEEADEQQGTLHGGRVVGEPGVARRGRSGQGGAESSGELRLLPVRYVRSLGPPLLIWAATTAVVVSCAAAFGYDPSRSATWVRWDSIQYLGIAHDGYDLSHCTNSYTPADWCGDAGWFPAYPWLVRALHFVGLPLGGAAVVVSWFFAAATLVLLWKTFFKKRTDVTVLGALIYGAWAPGQIYDYAVFPLSMLAFFTVASLWFLHRGRYAAAGLSGAVAALTYPLGVLLIPVSALWLLAQRGSPWRARLRRTAYASGLAALGVVALLIDQRIETGHWNAYFLVQDKYPPTFEPDRRDARLAAPTRARITFRAVEGARVPDGSGHRRTAGCDPAHAASPKEGRPFGRPPDPVGARDLGAPAEPVGGLDSEKSGGAAAAGDPAPAVTEAGPVCADRRGRSHRRCDGEALPARQDHLAETLWRCALTAGASPVPSSSSSVFSQRKSASVVPGR